MEEESVSDATVRPWADLVPDLLQHISGSIGDAADFVRFHAVCSTWRDTTSLSRYPPPFLPWLLAPGSHSHPSIAQFRSILSKANKATWRAPGTYSRRHRWLGTEDSTGTWLLALAAGGSSSPRLVNPFTGAATALPPFPVKTREYFSHVDGIVSSDGTVFLHAVLNRTKQFCHILAAVLKPGGAAWAEDQRLLMYTEGYFAAAHHRGSVVLVDRDQKHMVKLRVTGNGGLIMEALDTKRDEGLQPVPRRHSVHVFESRGELLVACVLLAISPDSRDLASALSVWIYALESKEGFLGEDQDRRWVRRDGWNLMNDRVLFLGCPTSFAVDAVGGGGGCAYFVLNSRNAGWMGIILPEASRVYRYSFGDGRATEVDELPLGTGWKDDTAMMWVTPRPSAIALSHEIRERLLQAPSSNKGTNNLIRHGRAEIGPPFKIFLGNLPSSVKKSELRQFFRKYGDVTDHRVIHDKETGSSYGYGFVTIATFEEPAQVFAMLQGEIFCGHVLRVKKQTARTSKRPKGPFVMPLLTQNKKA